MHDKKMLLLNDTLFPFSAAVSKQIQLTSRSIIDVCLRTAWIFHNNASIFHAEYSALMRDDIIFFPWKINTT